MKDLELLAEPFHHSQIHWRVGSTKQDKSAGMALAYLNARDVEDRLDNVCGRSNWQSRYPWSDGKKLTCEIGIRVATKQIMMDAGGGVLLPQPVEQSEWVWKSNGAGDTDYEADKGAYSDAFKRAAVPWGIGRYLYRSPNWWAAIVKRGKSYVFTDAAIKELNANYEKWLMPGKQQKYAAAYAENEEAFLATIEHIKQGQLDIAAEHWCQITDIDQAHLWLAVSSGGMLDQETKTVIRSTDFLVELARAQK